MQKTKQAFTLVELIVVIIIISILGTIAFISLQGYSKSSRDSVRISDVSNMKTSLELFHLNSGKYPLPDNGVEISYSGDILRTQGFFGENVISQLSRNLSKIPTDPLTDMQYIYSVANNRNEFEILAFLEADLALNTIPKTNAATLIVTPRLDGNYNGIFLKTPKYVVPIPSIINSEVDGLNLILDNTNIKSQITTGGENIPNYGNVNYNTGALTGLELSVAPSINSKSTDIEKLAVITAIQNAYTGSILNSDYAINNILSKTSDEDKLSFIEYVVLSSENIEISQQEENSTTNYGNLFIDGESIIEDEKGVHSIDNYGVTLNTSVKSIGNSSMYFSNSSYLYVPNSSDFLFGTGSFTIDFWYKNDFAGLASRIINTGFVNGAVDDNISLAHDYSNGNYGNGIYGLWYLSIGGAYYAIDPGKEYTNNFIHFAITRLGTELKVFVDGEQVFSVNSFGDVNSPNPLLIGGGVENVSGYYPITGYLDNIRIIKGEALWTENFNLTDEELFY